MDVNAALQTLSHHGAHLKERILARPILTGTIATLASTYLVAKLYHVSLRRQVKHIPHVPDSTRQASVEVREVECLPSQVLEHPRDFRIVHDKVVKVIPGPELGLLLARGDVDELDDVFTRLLRSNMVGFASTVQGWMMWALSGQKALRRTFRQDYIEDLSFREGDMMCGTWEVVKRDVLKVEFRLRVEGDLVRKVGPVEGLLVVSLRPRGTGAVLAVENVQFVKKDVGKKLPLEGSLAKWLHEVAGWKILLKGSKFLEGTAKARK